MREKQTQTRNKNKNTKQPRQTQTRNKQETTPLPPAPQRGWKPKTLPSVGVGSLDEGCGSRRVVYSKVHHTLTPDQLHFGYVLDRGSRWVNAGFFCFVFFFILLCFGLGFLILFYYLKFGWVFCCCFFSVPFYSELFFVGYSYGGDLNFFFLWDVRRRMFFSNKYDGLNQISSNKYDGLNQISSNK